MKGKVIIGIDYSSTSTGVVAVNLKGEYLFSYLIQPKVNNFDKRIMIMQKTIEEIVSDINNIIAVGIESPALFAKGKVVDLSAGYGYIKYSLLQNYEVHTFPPTTIKKFFTGSGRATKTDMINALPENVLMDFQAINPKKVDDLADAYAIAMLTLKTIQG